MTIDEFRRLALSFPEAQESSHMGHPDFRVRGKIFATLGYPDSGWAMVTLTTEQQEILVRAEPSVFVAVKGAWGRQGSTTVRLAGASKVTVRGALLQAWRKKAPKSLANRIQTLTS